MLPSLNVTKRDPKFNLLNNLYINIESKKNQHIFSENGVKKHSNDGYMS